MSCSGILFPEPIFLALRIFSDEEVQAVIVLCSEMGDAMRLPFYGAARTASTKLEKQFLSDRVRKKSA